MSILKSSLFLLCVMFYMPQSTYADQKIIAFVSILPQQYFVQQIGNAHVDVHVMVGPGQSPATYEPTPQQMAKLANADIYFKIGVPFESAWFDKLKTNNKKLVVVECCESLATINNHDHAHKQHTFYDPHVWTAPKNVIKIAKLIGSAMIALDKPNRDSYKAATKFFIKKLQKLDEIIREKTNNLKKRDLMVSHPSWGYFAAEYGFTQISIEQQGREIQARSMVQLIKQVREKNIKSIFVQPQFNDKAARVIADEINANIFILDPLAYNYFDNMYAVLENILLGLADE